jgi:hypothetical protein
MRPRRIGFAIARLAQPRLTAPLLADEPLQFRHDLE